MAKKPAKPVASIKHKDKRANIPTKELSDFIADDEALPKTVAFPGLLYARDPSLEGSESGWLLTCAGPNEVCYPSHPHGPPARLKDKIMARKYSPAPCIISMKVAEKVLGKSRSQICRDLQTGTLTGAGMNGRERMVLCDSTFISRLLIAAEKRDRQDQVPLRPRRAKQPISSVWSAVLLRMEYPQHLWLALASLPSDIKFRVAEVICPGHGEMRVRHEHPQIHLVLQRYPDAMQKHILEQTKEELSGTSLGKTVKRVEAQRLDDLLPEHLRERWAEFIGWPHDTVRLARTFLRDKKPTRHEVQNALRKAFNQQVVDAESAARDHREKSLADDLRKALGKR